jgi:hypothetical protein
MDLRMRKALEHIQNLVVTEKGTSKESNNGFL